MKGAPKVHQWMAVETGLNFTSWCHPVTGSLPAAPILHFPLKDPALIKRDAFNNSERGRTPPTGATKDPGKLLAKPASQQAASVSFASLAVHWPYGHHNHPWDESADFWSGAQKSHDTLISGADIVLHGANLSNTTACGSCSSARFFQQFKRREKKHLKTRSKISLWYKVRFVSYDQMGAILFPLEYSVQPSLKYSGLFVFNHK